MLNHAFLTIMVAMVVAIALHAFRWDQNASRWLLIGIVTGGMEITPHNPDVESPDPIGVIRRPHELLD